MGALGACQAIVASAYAKRWPVHEKVTELEQALPEVTGDVTDELVNFLGMFIGDMSRTELMQRLNLKHAEHFQLHYLSKGLELI